MRNLPPAVKNLLIINIIVFLGSSLVGDTAYEYLALFPVGSRFFHWWQFVTHMFMHGNFAHIFFNMWSLFVFGPVLERMWGSKKFMLFYFVCGLGAAACHELVLHLQIQNLLAEGTAAAQMQASRILATPTVGASGAIYGLLLGFGMLYPNYTLTLIFPPVSLKAKWFVLIFAAIELATGVLGTRDGVAHFAHLGGMLFGLILILLWKKKGEMYSEWQ
jgi:membrane associated rhomboid family serine protease